MLLNSSNYWAIAIKNTAGVYSIRFINRSANVETINISQDVTIATGTWYHIAVVRASNNFKFFLNGVQQGSDILNAVSLYTHSISSPHQIYLQNSGTGILNGNVTGFYEMYRISNIARYSGTFTPPASPFTTAVKNMVIPSINFNSGVEVDTVRIALIAKELDSITLNTDVVLAVSRDNGSTWTNANLNKYTYDNIKVIYFAEVDISAQPSGTTLKYRITTANTKKIRIFGAAFNWD
jgi:hypothetical protein